MTWEQAARRLGEDLASDGPVGYYSFTPEQWLAWASERAVARRAEYADLVDELDRVNAELEGLKQSRRWWERFFR